MCHTNTPDVRSYLRKYLTQLGLPEVLLFGEDRPPQARKLLRPPEDAICPAQTPRGIFFFARYFFAHKCVCTCVLLVVGNGETIERVLAF